LDQKFSDCRILPKIILKFSWGRIPPPPPLSYRSTFSGQLFKIYSDVDPCMIYHVAENFTELALNNNHSLTPYYLVPTKFNDLGQAHKNVTGLNKFCESSCLYLYKHRTTEKRQIQNKRRPETWESIEHSCVRVWERERGCLLYVVSYLIH
jgi:hypothetical protein